jgi:hypothetical protein
VAVNADRTVPEASAAAAPPVIDPRAVGSPEQWQELLGLSSTTSLRREVRLGRLTASLRLGRLWIVGSAILAWLRAAEVRPGRRRRGADGRNGTGKEGTPEERRSEA